MQNFSHVVLRRSPDGRLHSLIHFKCGHFEELVAEQRASLSCPQCHPQEAPERTEERTRRARTQLVPRLRPLGGGQRRKARLADGRTKADPTPRGMAAAGAQATGHAIAQSTGHAIGQPISGPAQANLPPARGPRVRYKPPSALAQRRARAHDMIRAGRANQEIALACGVSRQSVIRWRQQIGIIDPTHTALRFDADRSAIRQAILDGLSASDAKRRFGVAISTYHYWRKQLGVVSPPPPPKRGSSTNRERGEEMLLLGATPDAICGACGVSLQTVDRWRRSLKLPTPHTREIARERREWGEEIGEAEPERSSAQDLEAHADELAAAWQSGEQVAELAARYRVTRSVVYAFARRHRWPPVRRRRSNRRTES